MSKRLNPAVSERVHLTRRDVILSRAPMTRFSYAWGPLCRWPDVPTPEQVREMVQRDLRRMAQRVG